MPIKQKTVVESANFENRFIAVKYPGQVNNIEEALKTLGGLNTVSEVFSQPNRRLELRLRPNDVYCKPLCADREPTTKLLLKIEKIRISSDEEDSNSTETDSSTDTETSDSSDDTDESDSSTDTDDSTSEDEQDSDCSKSADTFNSNNEYSSKDTANICSEVANNPGYSKGADNANSNDLNIPGCSKDADNTNCFKDIDDLEFKETNDSETFNNEDNPSTDQNKDEDSGTIIYKCSILGVIDTIYNFNNLCDFQFLPADESNEGKLKNVLEDLLPKELPEEDWLQDKNVKLFLPPSSFSRFDSVHHLNSSKKEEPTKEDSKTAINNRKARTVYAIFASIKDKILPKEPFPEAMELLRQKNLDGVHYQTMKDLFDERPIWSRNAVMSRTNFTKDQIKYLLPAIAYYFTKGPWRVMWARYGYDPRKDPEAKIYQTFDYRIRTRTGMKKNIEAKRNTVNSVLKNTSVNRAQNSIISRHSIAKSYKTAKDESVKRPSIDERTYVFRPGMIPPFRQMFYQYCDVQVPEIQKMLSNIKTSGNAVCDERSGWLPSSFDSHCRDVVSELINTQLKCLKSSSQTDAHLDDDQIIDLDELEYVVDNLEPDKIEIIINDDELIDSTQGEINENFNDLENTESDVNMDFEDYFYKDSDNTDCEDTLMQE